MHEAYTIETVLSLDKSSPHDEFLSSTCYEDKLLVGTQAGVLHIFSIERSSNGILRVVAARQPVKQFARKAILKLKAFDDLGLLLCLCDGYVAVHDLNTLQQIVLIEKSKGTTDFSAKISRGTDARLELHLCMAIKKRVLLLSIKDRKVNEINPNRELTFPEIVKKVEWVSEKAVVAATKVEYHLFTDIFSSDKTVNLIATSNHTEPFIIPFQYNRQQIFAICQDSNMPLFDLNGGYVRNGRIAVSIKWPEPVLAVEYRDPYIIGLLPNKVEVRSCDPLTNIQSLDVNQKPLCVCAPSLLRFRSNSSIWTEAIESPVFFVTSANTFVLKPVPIRKQIDLLLKSGDFPLANRLGDSVPGEDGRALRIRIKSDCALAHHAKLEFTKSLELFAECNTDLLGVISLYPDILPDESRSTAAPIDMQVSIPPGERHRAFSELADHLLMRRSDIQANSSETIEMYTFNGVRKPISKVEALTMIDTASIKCYLETNNIIAVGAMLRQADCACHLQITERLLRDRQMYPELVQLYRRFKQHRRALEMLERHAKMADSVLRGHERTVEYLQSLGENDMAVLFEFAEWVVKLHPDDGLKIFTGPGATIAAREGSFLPVETVINYLENKNPNLLIPYIEFFALKEQRVVSTVSDSENSAAFNEFDLKSLHNRLAVLYLERYKRLQTSEEAKASVAVSQQQLSSSFGFHAGSPSSVSLLGGPLPPPGSSLSSASNSGSQTMTAEAAYARLMYFLSSSTYYEPSRLMSFFPENSEAKALLLGRSGDHESALSIFVLSLRKLEHAERHCDRFYSPSASKIYHIFVRLLLSFEPADGPVSPADTAFQSECVDRAISVLDRHATKMDHAEILKCLPAWIPLRRLKTYLLTAMRLSSMRLRQSQLHRALNEAQLLIVKNDMVRQHSVQFTVDDESVCAVCNMKIGLGTFVRNPSGALAHYLCFNEQSQKQQNLLRK